MALNFKPETLPSLDLSFTNISSAIESQAPQKISREAFSILKVVYEYFESLRPEDDIKEDFLNFQSVKAIIMSYYMLNDLMLAQVVGDRESARILKETNQLENALENLVSKNIFKLDVAALMADLEKELSEDNLNNFVENVRGVFKEALTSFLTFDKEKTG
jgi:hypothetical protein